MKNKESNSINFLENFVVDGGYCIGCGACSYATQGSVKMQTSKYGMYSPSFEECFPEMNVAIDPASVCPFGKPLFNETEIAKGLFSESANFDKDIGYHLSCHAGYVYEDDFRAKGASGGMGTWIALELVKAGHADAVIHVHATGKERGDDMLFRYVISNTEEDIRAGAKSRYYPIELSQVLAEIKQSAKRHVFIGIPCMVKTMRMLCAQDADLNAKIPFMIGLVCGHLKSKRFAEFIGWQCGVHPNELTAIDFRVKKDEGVAYDYCVSVSSDQQEEPIIARNYGLYGMDWGLGFFKYGACEFCDDVFAETADVTIGDAWLPKFFRDSLGHNVLVVRNPIIAELLQNAAKAKRLCLDDLSVGETAASQDAGLRHRRGGLSYRLHKKQKLGLWAPTKRVQPKAWRTSPLQRKVWDLREEIRSASHNRFEEALTLGSLESFKQSIDPLCNEYYKTSKRLKMFKMKNLLSLPRKSLSKILRKTGLRK